MIYLLKHISRGKERKHCFSYLTSHYIPISLEKQCIVTIRAKSFSGGISKQAASISIAETSLESHEAVATLSFLLTAKLVNTFQYSE